MALLLPVATRAQDAGTPDAGSVYDIPDASVGSAYLALLYGVDPTPVEAIGHIKSGMATDDLASDE